MGQRRVEVGATAVSLIRDSAGRWRMDGLGSPLERFGLVTGLFGVVVNQRVQGCVGRDQCGIGDHAAFWRHQPLLFADLDDSSEERLEDVFAITIADATERRVVRHLVIQRKPTEPTIGEVVMDVFAELPIGLDVVKVGHQKHPEKDFRIDGWPSNPRGIASGGEVADERRL